MKRLKIAIVGSGIAGLTCGHYLADKHAVTLFEAGDYIGGHTHTVEVAAADERASIDTGFIVFNDRTYPNFMKLMDALDVSYQQTEMSFSVRNDTIGLEYNGHNLNTLFAQRTNVMRPKFWKMLHEIVRFNREVKEAAETLPDLSIGEYLGIGGYSALFKENYILPMISAIWSMGLDRSVAMPLGFFVRFFENHGLLNITNRPQWYTITGGSSAYIDPLTKAFQDRIVLNTPVTRVEKKEKGVLIHSARGKEMYDEVIMACHGDQALKLLGNPTNDEKRILENFQFSDNTVVLHTDTSHLPRVQTAWASWNYHVVDAAKAQPILTYNMNILQRLQKQHTYLVTLNREIDPVHVIQQFNYQHPIFSAATITAQRQWARISGTEKIHFCGAYWFNGFHEDGVRSALRVCRMLQGGV